MKLTGQKILITGAGGFIGSHLSEQLARDNEVLLVDDFSIGSRDNLAALADHSRAQIVTADVTDLDSMRELAVGVDLIFHMAISCLRSSLHRPILNHDINAGGTLNVCLAAREQGVQRLIYVSSSEIYGTAVSAPMAEDHPCNPTTVYGASKLAGELYALAFWRTYQMPVVVVRPFNTYGPREPYAGARAEVIPRFILQLQGGKEPVVYGDGSQTRDFTFVDDTVAGILGAAACDELVGEVVNVAYGREVSIGRIAELLAELLGNPASVRYADPRPGDVHRHFADTAKARQRFGFKPQVELETGLQRTVEWFLSQKIASRVAADASGAPNW
jgi:UDP-glucose 4-epimerase